jgi:predicted RNA methylase
MRGMKVLDVGVGTGLVAAQACILTGSPALVTGVDPSPGMMAASKLPGTMVLKIPRQSGAIIGIASKLASLLSKSWLH